MHGFTSDIHGSGGLLHPPVLPFHQEDYALALFAVGDLLSESPAMINSSTTGTFSLRHREASILDP